MLENGTFCIEGLDSAAVPFDPSSALFCTSFLLHQHSVARRPHHPQQCQSPKNYGHPKGWIVVIVVVNPLLLLYAFSLDWRAFHFRASARVNAVTRGAICLHIGTESRRILLEMSLQLFGHDAFQKCQLHDVTQHVSFANVTLKPFEASHQFLPAFQRRADIIHRTSSRLQHPLKQRMFRINVVKDKRQFQGALERPPRRHVRHGEGNLT